MVPSTGDYQVQLRLVLQFTNLTVGQLGKKCDQADSMHSCD